MAFPFEDSPDNATIICRHIVHGGAAILYVSHDEDGTWQFMCGGTHETEDAMVVSLKEAYDIDHSIGDLTAMPCGYYAERKTQDSEWVIRSNEGLILTDEARIYIDLNERIDEDIFLLSKDDTKRDSKGNMITFRENMPILIWSDDGDGNGNPDMLLADAVAIKAGTGCPIPKSWLHVKWWCRVDMSTLVHESEYEAIKGRRQEHWNRQDQ